MNLTATILRVHSRDSWMALLFEASTGPDFVWPCKHLRIKGWRNWGEYPIKCDGFGEQLCMGIRDIEFVENPEPRCPVVLLIDTSASMGGSPLRQLNEAVDIFHSDIANDAQASLRVELAIVSFGGTVRVQRDFVAIHDWRPQPLISSGDTPMGEAIEMGLRMLEDRKVQYKSAGIYYYRPWVWLLTDGEPTDGERWRQAAQLVHAGEDRKAFSFFAVGVKGANFDVLRQIAPPSRKPMQLKGLNFKDMFLWLSASMKRVSTTRQGEQLALPPIEGWAEQQ